MLSLSDGLRALGLALLFAVGQLVFVVVYVYRGGRK